MNRTEQVDDQPGCQSSRQPEDEPRQPRLTIGEMVHDLGNSLAGVQMLAEQLARMVIADPSTAEIAGALKAELRETMDLYRSIRASLDRAPDRVAGEIDQVEGKFESLEINSLIRSSGVLLASLSGPAVEIVYRLAPEPTFVSGHEPRLHQVLTNLVANAAEAIQPVGGTLTIATERVEGSVAAGEPFHVRAGQLDERHYICLRVSDTGRGIPPALIGRIFQPGFTTKPSGHGDGLPSVRKIVEAYGGAVTATSLPGKGTTVCVYLPCAAPHGEAPAARVAVASPPTVLLVDDHDNTRTSSKFLLESRECGNFEVLACATGQAALESLQTRLADVAVAVLDMNLPDVKGIDLLAALRQIKPALPIIAVSGFGRDHFAWERAIEQPDVFLPKPFDVAELAAKLDEVLRGGASDHPCPLN